MTSSHSRSIPMGRAPRASVLALASALVLACGAPARAPATLAADGAAAEAPPPPPPARWLPLIGEYGPDSSSRILLERDGRLYLRTAANELPVVEQGATLVLVRAPGDTTALLVRREGESRVTALVVGDTVLARRQLGPESGNQLVIAPVRPIAELRREALAASPPAESGSFRAPDLVELVRLDSTIHLEVRYATANNLFATPFYSQARAFLQRPAAEALVRVSAALRARGYGLLVHDGYRPWYVTKMFWDATPPEKHVFVADPARGSRHNRGSAVDLTLYDRATGAPVEAPSTYDETSPRAYPDYPGGTTRQRWFRSLLRAAMEREGFTVYEAEWWHFDHRDWRHYPIMNVPFESLGR
ncbi:MAG TPA: M15 family metallopeptidase [Gemmatimonadaceae bacterium]